MTLTSPVPLQAPVYAPHLAILVKLMFLSSAIHQLVFVLSSGLPFAVGQVQDVGLIFLSAMATSVAGEHCSTPLAAPRAGWGGHGRSCPMACSCDSGSGCPLLCMLCCLSLAP